MFWSTGMRPKGFWPSNWILKLPCMNCWCTSGRPIGKAWYCGIVEWQETCIIHLVISESSCDHGVDWCEMEQPTFLSCCTKQAQRHVSHVEVRRPESCQWFVILDGDKILLEQKSRASARCIIHEQVGASSRCWTSAPWLAWIQNRNPFQDCLIIATYTILWSLTARLYLRPSIRAVMDHSAITPYSTHKSRRPASWNLFPMVDMRLQMVWNAPFSV